MVMSDQPSASSVRIWVLREGGLPLEERTVELGLEPIIIDDTPDRQALFFTFDGPGVLGLRADATGKQDRHIAGARMQSPKQARYLHGLRASGSSLSPQCPRCPSPANPARLHRRAGPVLSSRWSTAPSYRRLTAMSAPRGRAGGFTPKGDRWFRAWACPDHLEGLTGLRQFGVLTPSRAVVAPVSCSSSPPFPSGAVN